jgi:hypothetical protein
VRSRARRPAIFSADAPAGKGPEGKAMPPWPWWASLALVALTSVKVLTDVEKLVQDPGPETESIDRNTLVDSVKHAGKVQI